MLESARLDAPFSYPRLWAVVRDNRARGVGSFLGPFAAFRFVGHGDRGLRRSIGSPLLERIVPDAIRGRVAAAEMGGFMLALTASTLSVGLLLDRGAPPRALMAACGLVAVLSLAFWISAQPAFQVTGGRAPE